MEQQLIDPDVIRRTVDPRNARPLNIAIIVAGLGAGGAERVISLIAGDWVTKGNDVTIISFDGEKDPIFHRFDDRIQLVRLGISMGGGGFAGLKASLRRYVMLRKTLNCLAPDITLSFLTKINVLTLLACLGSKRRLVISERNNPQMQSASRIWRLLLARLHWRADAIIMQTRGSLKCLKGSSRWRARVIPNPISIAPIAEPARPRSVLTAAGRLTPQKGFDMLIDAFAIVASHHRDWVLTIWGEGECRPALEMQIARLGLGDRIRLPGNSPSPNHWTGQADAFVLSSRYEGFGNALGEAMAAGLPVAAFDCDYSPSDMIFPDQNGLLVPDGDVSALAKALDRLMGDAALRERLGRAASEMSNRFHLGTVMKRWDRVLADIRP